MSKNPLVEDYQQQTPYMAEAIAKATVLQDAGDALTGAGNVSLKQEPSSHETRRAPGD